MVWPTFTGCGNGWGWHLAWPWNSKAKSQRSEPKWLLKCLITPNICPKFQPNQMTTTFGPWNTFSHNDTHPTVTPLIRASIRATRYTSNPDITLFLIRSCKSTTFQRWLFLTESVEYGMLFKFFSSCPSWLLQTSSCRFLHP